jgi:hypothetical protein
MRVLFGPRIVVPRGCLFSSSAILNCSFASDACIDSGDGVRRIGVVTLSLAITDAVCVVFEVVV